MSNDAQRSVTSFLSAVAFVVMTASPTPAASAMEPTDQTQPQTIVASASDQRPATLTPLYVSFGVLQILDVHSTFRATRAGAREANPLMEGLLGSPAAFVAGKAGVAAGMFFVTERMRKRHPRAAVLTMIGLNSAYAIVVGHNYAVPGRIAAGR